VFQFSAGICRAVYTTNVIESFNYSLRRITKARASFPTAKAAIKLPLARIAKRREKMDNADQELAPDHEPIRHHLR
jgi:putative transposase